jgi:hypothetical protein
MTAITVNDLTQATTNGTGVFDVLMRATKAHLDAEFQQNRIKGSEYSTVYLGSLQAVMQTSLAFLLAKEKTDLEAQLLQAQINQLVAEKSLTDAKETLTLQQAANAVIEGTVLTAQKCKLDAEFDVLSETKLKIGAETTLLTQKVATEKAQITSLGVDGDSVVGRQKGLYLAQTNGFTRDAEQKAAKTLIDTWNARRMTDDATSANGTNMLDDASVGRVVTKLLVGVGA